jgi:DNA-binding beta-propeller fold protein YncE
MTPHAGAGRPNARVARRPPGPVPAGSRGARRRGRARTLRAVPVAAASLLALPAGPAAAQTAPAAAVPAAEYRVFVASEATDDISLIVFGPDGARVERRLTVGLMPTEADGPHGLAVSPDARFLYVTTGHGRPFGYLWKLDAATGREVGRVELGLFPASLEISPDGEFAFVANFNLHGDMVPSSVSVVSTSHMLEIARLETCTMPHGSRLDPSGARQYSTCMMDDALVEIDAWGLRVARHFALAPGGEHGAPGAPPAVAHAGHAGHTAHAGGGRAMQPECSPTWAQPAADGGSVFVACNRSDEIVEVDVADWSLRRRIPAGEGVYNLAVTRDGRLLVATNKRGASVSLFDTASGTELARVPTLRPVVHGVAISPDDRYAFISVEGIGSEPGTVEVIDLAARNTVAWVDVPPMAAGIAFWK